MDKQLKEVNSTVEAIVFRADKEYFALPVTQVVEVIRLPQIIELAKAPEVVVGVINFRNQITPVFDLNLILGFSAKPYSLATPILILRRGRQTLGLVVNEVLEVTTLEIAPNSLNEISSEAIKGLAPRQERLVFFLDLDKLVSAADRKLLGKALKELKQKNAGQTLSDTKRTVAKV
jgi:purine-binding chemotaxis protein CheW